MPATSCSPSFVFTVPPNSLSLESVAATQGASAARAGNKQAVRPKTSPSIRRMAAKAAFEDVNLVIGLGDVLGRRHSGGKFALSRYPAATIVSIFREATVLGAKSRQLSF